MIKVGTIVENKMCLKTLSQKLQKISKEANIKIEIKAFSKAEEVFNLIKQKKLEVDICIINVDFKKKSGIDIGAKILEYDFNIKVICLSENLDSIFKCLDIGAVDYIIKTQDGLERLKKSFRKALIQKNLIRGKRVVVKKNGELIDLRIRRIRYIEVLNKSLNIYYNKNVLEINKSMTEMESILKECRFIRPHKSYLVNLYYIEQIKGKDIILTTKEKIPISRLRIKEIKKIFEAFSENKLIIKNENFI